MSSSDKDNKVILKTREDYPVWKQQVINELEQEDCLEAINDPGDYTFDDARGILISYGATQADLTFNTVLKCHSDEMKKLKRARVKGAGIIGQRVPIQHSHLLVGKSAMERWNILRDKFQDVSPMAVCNILRRVQALTMTKCKDVQEFCSAYQEAYDAAVNLITDESEMTAQGAAMIIQGYMLTNAGDDFQAVVTQYQDNWTNGNTDIQKLSHALVNSAMNRDSTKAQSMQVKSKRPLTKVPLGTCTFPECVKNNKTAHKRESCWAEKPERMPALMKRKREQEKEQRNTKKDTNAKTSDTPTIES